MTEAGFIVVRIRRFDPSSGKDPYIQEYKIAAEEEIDVQNLLRDIYEKVDSTLAFRNCDCYRGVCSGCLISVNGKRSKACCTWVKPGAVLTITAAEGFPVIRDLVVEFRHSNSR